MTEQLVYSNIFDAIFPDDPEKAKRLEKEADLRLEEREIEIEALV